MHYSSPHSTASSRASTHTPIRLVDFVTFNAASLNSILSFVIILPVSKGSVRRCGSHNAVNSHIFDENTSYKLAFNLGLIPLCIYELSPRHRAERMNGNDQDEAAGIGGVVLKDGRSLEANVVIAADGIKSNSGKLIAGYSPEPKDSGQSIHRSGYSPQYVKDEPLVRERWPVKEGERPEWQFWLGSGLHLSVMVGTDMIVWGLTHKDEFFSNSGESWEHFVDSDEVCDLMEREAPGWDPAVKALIGTTPKGTLVHWRLRWRDLNKEWTSPGGRVLQVGDSAHSFLPASGNGATQAMEDAISIASCLQLGGKSNAAIATKIHNRLRYERISCGQMMSFVNTQQHHFTDWSLIAKDPKMIRTRFPKWVWQHDPEKYAYDMFGEAFLHVITDGEHPLKNTNYPPGHTHRPFTVEEVRSDLLNNVNIGAKLDGDWS